MADKTKIDWCDMSWNPVTGCMHGCPYCYAKNYATYRFGGASETHSNETVGTECQWHTEATGEIHVLDQPIYDPDRSRRAPYPYEFDPTFHRYRLGEPMTKARPRRIFVGSMTDLFGDWVPDEWIEEVFDACAKAPQHSYLFLTKNPKRYIALAQAGNLPAKKNMWYGTTATTPDEEFFWGGAWHTFVSIEPLLRDFSKEIIQMCDTFAQWVIVGAETGNRRNRVIPERRWVENIVDTCRASSVPVFMKNNLAQVWGPELLREFPDGLRGGKEVQP